MLIEAAIALLVAGAQQAGQSIQQWIQSPQGQQTINKIVQQYGPNVLQEIAKRLGLDR